MTREAAAHSRKLGCGKQTHGANDTGHGANDTGHGADSRTWSRSEAEREQASGQTVRLHDRRSIYLGQYQKPSIQHSDPQIFVEWMDDCPLSLSVLTLKLSIEPSWESRREWMALGMGGSHGHGLPSADDLRSHQACAHSLCRSFMMPWGPVK